MCFANSVLQILLHCPPFLKLFHELGKLGYSATDAPLTHATIEFLNEFVAKKQQPEEERDSFIPAGIYDAMKEKKRFDNMRGGHQEDAEEFLGFYLDTLEEELLAMITPEQPIAAVEEHEEDAPPVDDGWLEVGKKNRTVVTRTVKSTNSPITKIFGGKARSTLRAPTQKDSVIVEDWRALRLDIQPEHIHTIEDAVKHISDPQTIQRGGGMGDASQQMLVEALPAILILHVKRFHFDTTVGDVVKVGKQIVFGPELEIPLGEWTVFFLSTVTNVSQTSCRQHPAGRSSTSCSGRCIIMGCPRRAGIIRWMCYTGRTGYGSTMSWCRM